MPTTPRFGRDGDVAEVQQRLAHARLVTVTGAPGVGKSRVVADVAASWPGEVIVVRLAGVRTAADAADAVARALGLDTRTRPAPVAEALAARPGVLLVLDDAEEVDDLGASLHAWLAGPPAPDGPLGPRALAASRRRLGSPGEDVLDLGPLDQADAVALFVDRARAAGAPVDPADPAVAHLVDALDRLPLALELAAARVRLVPPPAWLDRLPTLAEAAGAGRRGSLHAALAASHQLLGPDARAALARATRLRGAFDLAAFEAVTGTGPDVLEELLDASWVRAEAPGRMRLLRVVRRFADALLDDPARADADARHARWAAGAGEAALAELPRTGWGPVEALRDDLRAATAAADREVAARAALVLGELVAAVGPLDEDTVRLPDPPPALRPRLELARARILRCRRRFTEAVAVLDAAAPEMPPALVPRAEVERAIGLLGAGDVHGARAALSRAAAGPDPGWEAALVDAMVLKAEGRLAEAAAVLEDALATRPDLDPRGRGQLHGTLAAVLRAEGQLERAVASLHRAAAEYRGGSERWEGIVMTWIATVLRDLGHNDAAAEAAEGAALRCARAGDRGFECDALLQLGLVRVEQGALDEARRVLERCRSRVADPRAQGITEALAATVDHRAGNLPAAVRHYRAAIALLAEAGARNELYGLQAELALALAAAADPDGARAVLAEARASSQPPAPIELRIAEEAIDGGVSDETRAEAAARRESGVRLVLALASPAPRVARDGSWFERADGLRVDLGRRRVLRRVLAALAAADRPLPLSAVVAAGWPGEKLVPASAASRVHVAVSSLRRMGLGDALVTEGGGAEVAYRLAPGVRTVGPPPEQDPW